MGFRCSILGCEYESAEPERDSEQRGDEVIHTVREYQECTRCGDRRLISENTGVITAPAVEADGSGSDPFGEAAPEPGETETGADAEFDEDLDETFVETDLPDGSSYDPDAEDDAVILGDDAGDESDESDESEDPGDFYDDFGEDDDVEFLDADAGSDPPADGTEPDATDLDPETEAADDPAEAAEVVDGEDAVVLGESESDAQAVARTDTEVGVDVDEPAANPETTRAPAGDAVVDGGTGEADDPDPDTGHEWPDADPATEPEYDHGAWPDPTDADDEGFDATPGDGAPLGADSDVDFSGLTPDADDEDAEFVGQSEPTDEADGHDAAVEHGPGARTTRTATAGQLHCEACGFGAPPSDTPHRAGDLCPGCGSDYLGERQPNVGRNP
jgi:hypothetical protein